MDFSKMENILRTNTGSGDNYFFLLPAFGLKFGGLTNVVLKKTRQLSDVAGYNCTILVMSYPIDFELVKSAQRENGKLGRNVNIQSMFDFFADETHSKLRRCKRVKIKKHKNLSYEYVKKHNMYRVYDNGLLIEAHIYDKDDNTIKRIDFYNKDRKKYKRDFFDKNRCLSRSTHMDATTGRVITDLYYRRDGSCYLLYLYNDEKIKIMWFDKDKSIKKIFRSEADVQRYYLDRLVSKKHKNFFISEKRLYDNAIIKMKSGDNIYKIMSHHGHTYPKIPDSFNENNQIDASVVLTERYKKDIQHTYPKNKKIIVIPNSFDGPDKMPNFNNRDMNRVISTSKYVRMKHIDQTIIAFRKVVDKIPDASLELYGYGPEESNLRELITKLGLTESVKLMGFSSSLDEVYRTSAISVSTSGIEGFSMSVLESLAWGCPAICYDIRYGPSDMIKDGKNGYLVQKDDTKQLSDRIIDSLSNRTQLEKMSATAYKGAKKFSDDEYIKAWINTLELVAKR